MQSDSSAPTFCPDSSVFRISRASINVVLPPEVTGVFDAATKKAVLELQALFGHAQTGVIDRRFWAYLARLYTLSIGDGTTSASSDAAFASNRYLL